MSVPRTSIPPIPLSSFLSLSAKLLPLSPPVLPQLVSFPAPRRFHLYPILRALDPNLTFPRPSLLDSLWKGPGLDIPFKAFSLHGVHLSPPLLAKAKGQAAYFQHDQGCPWGIQRAGRSLGILCRRL